MSVWHDDEGRLFNEKPTVRLLPLQSGRQCVVIDNALANPEGLREWASSQTFGPPASYPYPGLVCDVPAEISQRMSDFFAQHVRRLLGARRTLSLAARMSLITTPPEALAPIQWLCHRDRLVHDASDTLFAACVLYLFSDESLGGTSFYVPRHSQASTEALVADSQALDAPAFGSRYGLRAGYMNGSNTYFDRVAQVGPAWNRLIFYDGGLFHSADVGEPTRMVADPLRGRLTLNGFITCRKSAG